MRRSTILARAALALTLTVILGYGATAEQASAVQVTAQANVTTTISVAPASDDLGLNFGSFADDVAEVIITPNPLTTGDRTVDGSSSPGGSQAKFAVSGGISGSPFTVILPTTNTSNPVPIYLGGPIVTSGHQMEMHTFTTNWSSGDSPDDLSGVFYVGATLDVDVNGAPPAGDYAGYYDVTVSQP